MIRNKYYEIFLDDNNQITPESITYFTSKHIYNELSKKDTIKNTVLSDYSQNYLFRFEKLMSSCDCVLGYINDDIHDYYSFSSSHLQKILNNPKNKIVKEKQLIRKEKLKTIDSNTFKWLGTKPGSTIKEKLANSSKILSTVKRFSNDTKENQVTKTYFKQIYNLMLAKFEFMANNPNVFSEEASKEHIKRLKMELNKFKQTVKDVFEDVMEKEHSSPNNTLIGNVDYHSIWETYRKIKTIKPDISDNMDYFKYLYKLIMLCFVNSNEYKYIDKHSNLFKDEDDYIVYKYSDDKINEITFNINDEMTILFSEYSIRDNVFELTDEKEIIITCEYNEDKNVEHRGMYFELSLDSETFTSSYADLMGTKKILDELCSLFNISLKVEKEIEEEKITPLFASINSYDNSIYSNENKINPHIIMPHVLDVKPESLYFSNAQNLYINSIFDNDYSYVLSTIKKTINLDTNDLLIYDIKDTFDEFSSRDIRRKYSSAFPKSYPVWRSILAGETITDKDNISYVVDMTGREFYVSKLKRKNDLFVHCGPVDLPLFFEKYTEKEFLNCYIDLFEEKYDIEYPREIRVDLLDSGKLFNVLLKKSTDKKILIEGNYYDHEYHYIYFDEELFEECVSEFTYRMNLAMETYPLENSIYIIPDFLYEICDNHIISNKMLLIGAETIKTRVISNKIAWYEILPKLSLEIINNGYFDTLQLVDNQECENIIGKTIGFDIFEEFTLQAGEEEYILPLNKSFVGEQNMSFVAKLKDPSFPLKKDVKVKLKLKYCFGSENSYELSFVPISSEAPFKKIIVEWEKAIYNQDLIYPLMKDVEYTPERALEEFEKIKARIDSISKLYTYNFIRYDDFMRTVKFACNDYQKLVCYDYSYNEPLLEYISTTNAVETIKKVIKQKKNENFKRYYADIYMMEQAIITFTQDKNSFLDGRLNCPSASYGRYLCFHPDDEDIINNALETLVKFSKNTDYMQTPTPRVYLDRLTSGTSCKHLFFAEITKTNPIYTTELLNFMVSTLKYLSTYKFCFNRDPEFDSFYNNPKENVFLARFIIELLFSFLFVRESVYFQELKPGGRLANEIIHYLKEFNKHYMDAQKIWPDGKKPKVRMKYRMVAKNKPANLYNMWDELYCLILYLSGSEEANYITISSDGEKDE